MDYKTAYTLFQKAQPWYKDDNIPKEILQAKQEDIGSLFCSPDTKTIVAIIEKKYLDKKPSSFWVLLIKKGKIRALTRAHTTLCSSLFHDINRLVPNLSRLY